MKKNVIGDKVVKLLGGEQKLRDTLGAWGFEYEYGVSFYFYGKNANRFEARPNGSEMLDVIFYRNSRILFHSSKVCFGPWEWKTPEEFETCFHSF